MTSGQRYWIAFLCAAFALLTVALVFWPRKQPEANAIPQARESVASLKNQVMDKLLEQQSLPADYGAEMIGLYRNRANDELLRNFAVQHLELYAGALAVRGGYDAASDEASRIRSAMDAASRETDSSIGGTAMLGLERLSRLDAQVDRAAIATRAAACAANASSDLQSRIAAVQVCGEMRIQASAATLRALGDDPAANTVLRLSARHSLSLLAE